MNELEPYSGIIEQLKQLVNEGKLCDSDLVKVIDNITFITEVPSPSLREKLMMKLGLLTEEQFWQLSYQRKDIQLQQRLSPHLIEIVRQIIIKGAKP